MAIRGQPSEAADHHYVPKFYLKGFTDKKGALWVYEKGKTAPRQSSPKAEGNRKNYYIFTDRGYADDAAEKVLSRAESVVSPVIRKIANPQFRMNEKQRGELFTFVALTVVRVPAYRDFLDKQFGRAVKIFSKKMALIAKAFIPQ